MACCVRLKLVPRSVTKDEIIKFLGDAKISNGKEGIFMMGYNIKGRKEFGAFVLLEGEEDLELALKKNLEKIDTKGGMQVEIVKSEPSEYEDAKKRHEDSNSNVLKLHGLPYSIKREEIEKFFDGCKIKEGDEGILFCKRNMRFTGDAYVRFESEDDTEKALTHHMETIGTRYIEVFRSKLSEMESQSKRPQRIRRRRRDGPYDGKDRRDRRGGRDNYRGRENNYSRFNDNFGIQDFGGGFRDDFVRRLLSDRVRGGRDNYSRDRSNDFGRRRRGPF